MGWRISPDVRFDSLEVQLADLRTCMESSNINTVSLLSLRRCLLHFCQVFGTFFKLFAAFAEHTETMLESLNLP